DDKTADHHVVARLHQSACGDIRQSRWHEYESATAPGECDGAPSGRIYLEVVHGHIRHSNFRPHVSPVLSAVAAVPHPDIASHKDHARIAGIDSNRVLRQVDWWAYVLPCGRAREGVRSLEYVARSIRRALVKAGQRDIKNVGVSRIEHEF